MAEFASKGVAGTGLGLGIAGTALGLLPSLTSGSLFNTTSTPSSFEMEAACQHDVQCAREMAQKDAEIARLNSERYADSVGLKLFEYVAGQLTDIRSSIANNKDAASSNFAAQAVYNATTANSLSAINNTLGSLTKCVIPMSSICPEPMPLYNSWTAPTTTT